MAFAGRGVHVSIFENTRLSSKRDFQLFLSPGLSPAFEPRPRLNGQQPNLKCAPRGLRPATPIVIDLSCFCWRVCAGKLQCGSQQAALVAAIAIGDEVSAGASEAVEPGTGQTLPANIHGVVASKDGELYEGVHVTLTVIGPGAPAQEIIAVH